MPIDDRHIYKILYLQYFVLNNNKFMLVSIFKDLTFVVWVDYSYTPQKESFTEFNDENTWEIVADNIPVITPEKGNPDCIACIEVDFNPSIETLEIVEKKGKYSANIIPIPPPPETPEDRKSRIRNILITTDEYTTVDTEWVTFDKSEVWPMIISRYYKWDQNAEMAYLQQWNYLKDKENRTPEEDEKLAFIRAGYEYKEAFKNFILSLCR